ncbi:hypothetical protein H6F86_08515 [Phormidium sp. FACHB-592]|uniref:Uncharacterized protein n=1 Tax=Stenomitos frigidus AS-A4 TaxID=2933935 RepID=A0ABV0KRE1_9CYAN|nr:hypothetical protein [Phormidium sp. FACHB-592]MBD2073931.1 hypothetical protein [Phormidium sp. FACHB-592]
MKDATDDGSKVEWLWNTRDGVTPFCVSNRAGNKMMQHVDWQIDRCLPNYQPYPGEHIFIDLTPERALQRATVKMEYWWEHPEHPMCTRFASKEAAINLFLNDFKIGEAPDVIETGTAQLVDSAKTGKALWN